MSVTITLKLERAVTCGMWTGLVCLIVLLGMGAWFTHYPDAIYTMPEWLAGWVVFIVFTSFMMLPVSATYTLLCMAGLVYMDWREGKAESEEGHTVQFTVGEAKD